MATGSITSLGLGSGFELQDILDKLKQADETRIKARQAQKTTLQSRADAYDTINAKLFSIKSKALNLSLTSNFMSNAVSATNDGIVSATIGDGYAESTYSIEVIQKARRNSWQSAAVSSKTDPLLAQPATGISDLEAAVTSQPETLTFYYGASGEEKQIDIDLEADLSLSEVADRINQASANRDSNGDQLVTASTVRGKDGDYYIRLSATSGGNTIDSEITVSGFDWVAADTTVSIAQGDATMYLTMAPGTTYQEMANLINGAPNNPGVTAAIINNGNADNPYQLALTSNHTGENARLILKNLDMLTEVTGAGAESLNAEFTVNGITYARQSNTGIKDVIDGMTLTLKSTGETSLNVEASLGTVKEDILAMVKGFNEVMAYIRGTDNQETEDEADHPLKNQTSANRILYQLQSLLTSVLDLDTNYKSLSDIGLKIDKGTVSIDESLLDAAISANPDALKTLFIGDPDKDIKGLADTFNDALADMVSSSGITSTEIDQAESKIRRIDQDIETGTERLNRKYETMAAEFVRLDAYISQLNAQSGVLTSMIDAFNKTKEK